MNDSNFLTLRKSLACRKSQTVQIPEVSRSMMLVDSALCPLAAAGILAPQSSRSRNLTSRKHASSRQRYASYASWKCCRSTAFWRKEICFQFRRSGSARGVSRLARWTYVKTCQGWKFTDSMQQGGVPIYWPHQCIMEAVRVESCLRKAGCNRADIQSIPKPASGCITDEGKESRRGPTLRWPSLHSNSFAFGVWFLWIFHPFHEAFDIAYLLIRVQSKRKYAWFASTCRPSLARIFQQFRQFRRRVCEFVGCG